MLHELFSAAHSVTTTTAGSGSSTSSGAVTAAVVAAGVAIVAAGVNLVVGWRTGDAGKKTATAADRAAIASQESAKAAQDSADAAQRGVVDLEARSRREEVMRTVRWAAQLGIDSDWRRASLGVNQLAALTRSDILDPKFQVFIDAALEAILEDPRTTYEGAEQANQEPETRLSEEMDQ